ncbi:DNA-binding transcriptional LysR family regulator [Caulobacter ginsengisoli]|uniref:DNA-binding transcriptional LysR family regulator n=1 Tax=Caulobacter ginsengisoli TaxID=400775 RepID=A0ABU0IN99_9CAUL|nr:LysR family transcriptional regulator [Caulobacter ginsengisoli]MDQ0463475.1 DNA-binding transcriptional LysR family regulator [Caulobacter ginsengisoli]
MDRLDPHALEVFLAVAETGSASLASRRLRLTQPTVTHAIGQLEKQTGLTLFERGRFGMRPTAEGLLFGEAVRRSFAGLDRITAAAEAIRRGVRGQLVIAALPVYADGFVHHAIGRLAARSPDLNVRTETHGPEEVLRKVLHDQADLGVIIGPLPGQTQLTVHRLGERRLMAVMNASHPLAARSEVGVADLADQEMVLMAPPNPHRTMIAQAFAAAGAPLQARLESTTQRGAGILALTSGTMTLIDQEMAGELARLDPDVHLATFTAAPSWEVLAVHSKDRPLTLASEAALEALRHEMAAR